MIRFDKKALSERETIAHVTEIPVRFQDVDAAGIVFFARFFDYTHAAYEDFLAATGHPLPAVLRAQQWAAPLRHAEADYLTPVRFGDRLTIELVAAHLEDSEVTLGWRIWRSKSDVKPAALVQTVHTFVTADSFERCGIPAEISRKLGSVQL